MRLVSGAFEPGGAIPRYYTADGPNMSPPLKWGGVPEGTGSMVLLCNDPDAPRGDWVHWVVFNIPPDIRELPEGLSHLGRLQNGAYQGLNDFGTTGYGGPSPPTGEHRYYFRLYALDRLLSLGPAASRALVLEQMEGHILATAELMGTYSRSPVRSHPAS